LSARKALRDIEHLLSKSEEELENGRVLTALSSYMMAQDLANGALCEVGHAPPDLVFEREWAAIRHEMGIVMDEIGDQLRALGAR